jgi:hypothetical protein
MMVLGLVTTSAVCFMLLVRDHPYSAAIFGLLAVLPIAYFFKTYAGPAFPLHLPTQALTFETWHNACALCCVRWCVGACACGGACVMCMCVLTTHQQ